ncbi:hypothetical protein [Marixanthomonas ophiurae]|uniref:Right-handed parallel beta-helix repeat-containing protein n=1 Tax=Marixanthomonas ophiurae TaxID=387659 RepID=A0A3E1Q6F3_9FLAO|nr:hypothetical protein [Marixanthomonas ophiurae]RFN57699.1 hypothetical protein DZ858_10635 [Marixanthomonas ophiurae]
MKYVYGLAILACLVLWSSCRNDFESVPSTGNLEFSRDTVYLDTIFSNIGSSTYNLKVYNRSDEDINIPSINLANGETSSYRLNVDGIPGKSFQDIQVLAKDSIFIFIETTADINTLPTEETNFLYTDQLQFDTGGNQQNVELVTLIQDAVFLFPERFGDGTSETLNLGTDGEGNDILIEGFFLDDNELTFTNEKPYVIYGYAAVPPQKTLNIEAGTRVHFHASSGILVANTGSIKANGEQSNDPELLENEIIFEGDRLEPAFADVPGQWGAIWMTSGSTDNEFKYTTIKNGTVGLLMDDNDGDRTLTLENVQIYNSANSGLLARTGNVYGENVVINNSGQASLSASLGGTYTFNHCTFANYWTNSFRSFPTVLIDNFFETDTGTEPYDLNISFNNCIIYGNEQREIALLKDDGKTFNFNFSNSLIRFEDPNGEFSDNPLYDFTNTALYTNSVFNEDPVFQDTEMNNFNIETGTSAADGIGNTTTAQQVPVDLNGTNRNTQAPDAGAYESTAFPEEE